MGNFARITLLGNSRSDSEAAGTKRYKLTRLNEATGQQEPVTQFETMEDLVYAQSVKDENGKDVYSTDAAYRISVQEIAANSPALFSEPTMARKSAIPTDEEFLEGLRHDAAQQKYAQLVEAAGGNDAISKLALAEALMNPEFREAALGLQERIEEPRPFEQMLKDRKSRGEGPLQWNFSVDADKAIRSNDQNLADMADSDGAIIEMEAQS